MKNILGSSCGFVGFVCQWTCIIEIFYQFAIVKSIKVSTMPMSGGKPWQLTVHPIISSCQWHRIWIVAWTPEWWTRHGTAQPSHSYLFAASCTRLCHFYVSAPFSSCRLWGSVARTSLPDLPDASKNCAVKSVCWWQWASPHRRWKCSFFWQQCCCCCIRFQNQFQ